MDEQQKIAFLSMDDWKRKLLPELTKKDWINVFLTQDINTPEYHQSITIYPILISHDRVNDVLTSYKWESHIGDLTPSLFEVDNREVYSRYGNIESIEPLILWRSFPSHIESYYEICEDFRLFHNLYYDQQKSVFLTFKKYVETEVIKTTPTSVEIHRKELLQFLSAKQYCLVLQVDILRLINITTNSFQEGIVDFQDDVMTYNYYADEFNFSFNKRSRLIGKVLLNNLPIKYSGIYPYEEDERYADFIVGIDEYGNEIFHTANISDVSYENGNFMIPVYFEKSVLDKYYKDNIRYEVRDGSVHKIRNVWSLRLDNNRDDCVIVFLGDLGRDLPYEEQLHWKSYNIRPPSDKGLSEVHYRRSILGEWVEPEDKSFLFKSRFEVFQKKWFNKFNWYLFKLLSPEDAHNFSKLRTPITNNLSEFDELCLAFTKVIIDSINEDAIKNLITSSDEKGIKKLAKYLEQENLPDYENLLEFMVNLQFMRSKSSAHRKGKKFHEELSKKGLDISNPKKQFEQFLDGAINLMEALERHFL